MTRNRVIISAFTIGVVALVYFVYVAQDETPQNPSNSTRIRDVTMTLALTKSSYQVGENVTFSWTLLNPTRSNVLIPEPVPSFKIYNSTTLVWASNSNDILRRDSGNEPLGPPRITVEPIHLDPGEALTDEFRWNMSQRRRVCIREGNSNVCRYPSDIPVPSGDYRLVLELYFNPALNGEFRRSFAGDHVLELEFTIVA